MSGSNKSCHILSSIGAVCRSGNTVDMVTRAAVPVGKGTTSIRASGLIGSTLLLASHLHELLPLGNKGTVRSSGSTEDVVRTAVAVFLRATSHRAPNLAIIALFRFQKF